MTETQANKLIVAIDPGDKNNGFAFFKWDAETKKADLRILDSYLEPQLYGQLEIIQGMAQAGAPLEFVVENFRVDTNNVSGRSRSRAMFQWSEVATSQRIGAIKYVAHCVGAKITLQEPGQVLPMGRKWCDYPLPKGHIPDKYSAYIHGVHYMMNRKMIRGVWDVLKFGQEPIE